MQEGAVAARMVLPRTSFGDSFSKLSATRLRTDLGAGARRGPVPIWRSPRGRSPDWRGRDRPEVPAASCDLALALSRKRSAPRVAVEHPVVPAYQLAGALATPRKTFPHAGEWQSGRAGRCGPGGAARCAMTGTAPSRWLSADPSDDPGSGRVRSATLPALRHPPRSPRENPGANGSERDGTRSNGLATHIEAIRQRAHRLGGRRIRRRALGPLAHAGESGPRLGRILAERRNARGES